MRIIVTGASGWLAGAIGEAVVNSRRDVSLVGVSGSVGGRRTIWSEWVGNSEYLDSFVHESEDVVVHCAFCRKSDGRGLLESLDWSSRVFDKAMQERVAGIVNISSQSVYGGKLSSRVENAPLAPSYLYALAKASSEVLLESIARSYGFSGGWTNLRMASLMGVSGGTCPNNVLRKLCERAIRGEAIEIVGGTQRFSFLDVSDAAKAVLALMNRMPLDWRHVYNIGMNGQIPIIEMTELIVSQAALVTGYGESQVSIISGESDVCAGMVCDLARDDLGWEPKKTIVEIVENTLRWCEAHY